MRFSFVASQAKFSTFFLLFLINWISAYLEI